jgi:hypothetical protein
LYLWADVIGDMLIVAGVRGMTVTGARVMTTTGGEEDMTGMMGMAVTGTEEIFLNMDHRIRKADWLNKKTLIFAKCDNHQ